MPLQKALPVEPEHSIAAAKSADHLAAHVSLLSQTPCGTLLHTPLLQVRLSDQPLGPFSGNLRFDNKLETIVRPLAQIADESGGFNGESGQFSAVRPWPASSRALQLVPTSTVPNQTCEKAYVIRGEAHTLSIGSPEDKCKNKKGHVAHFEGATWPLGYHQLLAGVLSCR